MSRPRQRRRRRPVDPARRVAYDALRAVHADDAYANLVLSDLLRERRIGGRDAGFATELLHGTCRAEGSYDLILEAASGRPVSGLQPAVLDVLRLGVHQLLAMRVPTHAAVDASVDLAAAAVGERVTGLVNAVLRKVAAHDRQAWNARITEGMSARDALAVEHDHPRWIVDAFAAALAACPAGESSDELAELLAADNDPASPTLVVRPGLATRDELVAASGGRPTELSPFGVHATGYPGDLDAVRAGRAGVQDEGSQLVSRALTVPEAPSGAWLDLCAGPGGKSALLHGLAAEQHTWVLAAELQHHRARLVARSLRAYPGLPRVITADGTRPAWREGSFARVLADVPCTGLGSLRRRPESRWRRSSGALSDLVPLQRTLLHRALDAAKPAGADTPGGVVAYVTCSPHPAETDEVVAAVLAERDDVTVLDAPSALGDVAGVRRRELAPGAWSAQLWPHRHGTDAMYLALLQRR
ncbi:RsmB/NOP family class I SAM-dependent RNA methyltransferase [Enemella sp. A6]|uniref:RsmB/NOP family class I SAM-dependent RNA methyltransferase n=1 Tax=Enemella sp. A6 TaxID=3440152 RepID=UPI003EBDFDB6